MILILCQEIKNGEKSRRVREGVREKIGFELDLEGQGVVSGAEGRWEGISDGANSETSWGWPGPAPASLWLMRGAGSGSGSGSACGCLLGAGRTAVARHPGSEEAEPWQQGAHGLGRGSLAGALQSGMICVGEAWLDWLHETG